MTNKDKINELNDLIFVDSSNDMGSKQFKLLVENTQEGRIRES